MEKFTDFQLIYSATSRCRCGAGLAHPLDTDKALQLRAWVCSKVLNGGVSDADTNQHESYDFSFYKVREESSINNDCGETTRPSGTVARTVGKAHCNACGNRWKSDPYSACGASHHWDCGPCPTCGNDCGAGLMWRSDDKRPRIDTRFADVVLSDVENKSSSVPQ